MMNPSNILVDERFIVHGDFNPLFCRMYSEILENNPSIKKIAVVIKPEILVDAEWRAGYQSLRFSRAQIFTEIYTAIDWLSAAETVSRLHVTR